MDRDEPRRRSNGVRGLSTPELIGEAIGRTQVLIKEEIALAKTEAREQVRSTVKTATGLGAGLVIGNYAVMALLAAAILGLSAVMQPWGAALIVGGVLLVIAIIAAAVGWAKRVRTPLERTIRTTKDDVRWVKEKTH